MDPESYQRSWNSLCEAVDFTGIFDSEYRQPHSQCMANTRVALRERITQVLDRRDQTNVWLKGLAGVGKSSIAFTISEELKAAERLAATFFFSHKHAQQGAAIIPTIAYQLALAIPHIQDKIVYAIKNDRMLLSPGKSRADQMRELVIKPLQELKDVYWRNTTDSQIVPLVITIDALDECLFSEEAARLVTLLTNALADPDLPIIHVIFTSRPEAHIGAAMPSGVYEIPLTTRDEDTKRDVRFFLRASLNKTRTARPVLFDEPTIPWPSEKEFEELAFKAGGLFVYAAMAINFISAAGHHPQERLDLLLREKSTVGADIDQFYRQIIGTSEDPIAHCRILASIIHLSRPLPLVELQVLFHADKMSLALTLETFSPVILNDGVGDVEIYHASLRDFMIDPLRSKEYHIDDAHAHEHILCRCLDFFLREGSPFQYSYPSTTWATHLAGVCPSSEIQDLLVLLTGRLLQLQASETTDSPLRYFPYRSLSNAIETCSSSKWNRYPLVAQRLRRAHGVMEKNDKEQCDRLLSWSESGFRPSEFWRVSIQLPLRSRSKV
ncbi:hypothetical protein EDB19DRAFT_1302699 [Suillus lakei]|nr:hypothetical protein EDB19DRAFT_1302699 [Suillus lakei]